MLDPVIIKLSFFDLFGIRTQPDGDHRLVDHLLKTVDWIIQAHVNTADEGISKGYNLLRACWYPSYPETTGYTIPTLLNVAILLDRSDLMTLAIHLANYLINNTTHDGGVVYWDIKSQQKPIVFDTGQAIFGWLAAYDASGDKRFLCAAKKSGDWLVSIQDTSGSWKKHQHLGVEKVIDTRVAWALLELYKRTNQDQYRQVAVNNLNWAIKQQSSDGWFKKCAFLEGEDPFTHTIAYTAEGLFESGIILDRNPYIEAAQKTAEALLVRQHKNGDLSSTFGSGWVETSHSSCLTGNCQVGLLWLRLFKVTSNKEYLRAARKAITFVARTQNLKTSNPNIRGGIAGSYPIYGKYERFKYPNWAAKFFIDALLALGELTSNDKYLWYVG